MLVFDLDIGFIRMVRFKDWLNSIFWRLIDVLMVILIVSFGKWLWSFERNFGSYVCVIVFVILSCNRLEMLFLVMMFFLMCFVIVMICLVCFFKRIFFWVRMIFVVLWLNSLVLR